MTKKNIFVLALTILVVGSLYFYLYKDSFHKAGIQIVCSSRPKPSALFRKTANQDDPLGNNITFGLSGDYRLTSVKVVDADEIKTNKYAHPLWELTTDSNSVPVRAFVYGSHIHGMHPPVKGQVPAALTPEIPYRLLVEAGSLKGERDFTLTEDNHLEQTPIPPSTK